jgi:hypothetical protein
MKYFLHHTRSGECLNDAGLTVIELGDARVEAMALAREIMIDRLKRDEELRPFCFEIVDQAGKALLSVSFDSSIADEPEEKPLKFRCGSPMPARRKRANTEHQRSNE